MENKQDFEERIRIELKLKGNELCPSDELYSRIMNDVVNNKKVNFTMFKNRILNIGGKRLSIAILSAFMILSIVSFSTSSNLKAFATETINNIKTIFVLDETLKVVEKDADTTFMVQSTSKNTILSDNELTKKVGYQVFLPKVLCNDMKLTDKSESILIKVPYTDGQNLQPNMFKAIDDETVFKSLAAYEPTRGVNAEYTNDKTQLSICIIPTSAETNKDLSSSPSTKVDLNGTIGYWYEAPALSYPLIKHNGITQNDMTKQPKVIKTVHSLFWSSNGIFYAMGFFSDNELSMDETVAMAKSFIDQSTK